MNSEQEKQEILEIIKEHNEGPSSLIQVLTLVQEARGYLPKETQQLVAKELKVPLSRVYEVSSFYARFTTEPKGRYEISVCLGTACYILGAQGILDEIKNNLNIKEKETTPDGLFTLNSCRCIGACGLAPVLFINKDVHGKLKKEMIPELLETYKKRGNN